jgi:hypothetical protein
MVSRGTTISSGSILQALVPGKVKAREIQSGRVLPLPQNAVT